MFCFKEKRKRKEKESKITATLPQSLDEWNDILKETEANGKEDEVVPVKKARRKKDKVVS